MLLSTLLITALATSLPSINEGDDWPHLRGPGLDGRAGGALGGESIGLRTAWKAPLGPSYSGVAVAGGRVVTMFSDGAIDWVVALDAGDGRVLWTHELGEIYLGHDGSEDGPISSPVIDAETVFAVGPRGQLLALGAADGAVRWSKHLVDDLGAAAPSYGFTTTPLVEGDTLVVQVGGSEGRLVCGFDKATGELRWSAGEGEAGYASPCGMDLAGTRTVVVLNGQEILGIAPENGAVLWVLALGEQEFVGSGIAGAVDGERFFAPVAGGMTVYKVSEAETGFELEPVSRSRDLGRTYAAPVVFDGHLYGYKSDFLSCVNIETGKRAWRSRPPGGKGLILVGDRLVVFGAEGAVAVVRATPDGYEELTRHTALEHSSFTWPAFAGGKIFVRNNAEIACVELVDGEAVETGAEAGLAAADAKLGTGAFASFINGLDGAEDKATLIDAFLASRESMPVIEGNVVHFLYRGEAEDVAIAGSMVEGGTEPLARIEGTDVHHRAFEIEPGARWEYRFQVNYEEWQPDALNPRSVPDGNGGALSEVVTDGYEEVAHFLEPGPEVARGRLDTFEFTSEQLENTREISVYLPAGYDESEDAYPLLIVHRGTDYLEHAGFTNTLDHLIGDSVRPLVVAFVPPQRRWWYEGGGSATGEYLDMLASEFIDTLGERYRLLDGPENRGLLGQQEFGLTVAYGGLKHPEVFGMVAIQSPAIEDVSRHALYELIGSDPLEPVRFHLDWNRYEAKHPDNNIDHGDDARRLYGALKDAGFTVTGGEVLDAAGWGAWRARTDDVLEAFFGLGSGQ